MIGCILASLLLYETGRSVYLEAYIRPALRLGASCIGRILSKCISLLQIFYY